MEEPDSLGSKERDQDLAEPWELSPFVGRGLNVRSSLSGYRKDGLGRGAPYFVEGGQWEEKKTHSPPLSRKLSFPAAGAPGSAPLPVLIPGPSL